MMAVLQFDLILLDVNMPVMNGRITIKHIMIKSPCPIVIMSNVGSRAPETILSLLDLGAVDFISKPVRGGDFLLQQQKIVERVRRSAMANTSVFRRFRPPPRQLIGDVADLLDHDSPPPEGLRLTRKRLAELDIKLATLNNIVDCFKFYSIDEDLHE